MIIYCTEKLKNEIKASEKPVAETDPFFSWHAALTSVRFRRTFIAVNDSNRMVLILYDIKIKDYPYLTDMIRSGIKEIMRSQRVRPELIDAYLEAAGDMCFAAAKADSFIAALATATVEMELLEPFFKRNSTHQPYVNRWVNQSLREISKHNNPTTPYEMLYRDFETMGGVNVVSTAAFHLRIFLNVSRDEEWLELLVPDFFLFESLHRLVSSVLAREDDTLHDFHLYGGNGEEALHIVCDEELLPYDVDVPMALEWETTLCDWIPKFKLIQYTSDLDLNLSYSITWVGTEKDYDNPYPVCLGGVSQTNSTADAGMKSLTTLDLGEVNERIRYVR